MTIPAGDAGKSVAASGPLGQVGAVPPPTIDIALVQRLVARQFPRWSHLPVTAAPRSGWDNRTFRLGEEMLVRLPSAEEYAGQVAKEQRWLPVLAPQVPLPIPVPLAMGAPGEGYPFPWSVHRWLDGTDAGRSSVIDLTEFAVDLAAFLAALQQVDPSDGPRPGAENFFRGAPLAHYDAQTRRAIDVLGDTIDRAAVTAVWQRAVSSAWRLPPRWFHGDVALGNLLVRGGRLAGVLDFGLCGVGDPAGDLTVAWTAFSAASREAFRAGLDLDAETWARGRGWALWKALIVRAGLSETNAVDLQNPDAVIAAVLADG
jgi:aminoglycoside phosphotransferase (APT) family kinase protein